VSQFFLAIGALLILLAAGGLILWGRRRRARRQRDARLHGEDFVDPSVDRGAAMLQNRLDDDRRRDAHEPSPGSRPRE